MFNRDGSVDKKSAFCELMRIRSLREGDSIKEKLSEWDDIIKSREPSVTSGALNNCHGDWYEWVLGVCAWNTRIQKESAKHCLLLPNITRFDVHSLYRENVFELINDLKEKVEQASNVNFVTSNPDMVLIESAEGLGEENEIHLSSVETTDLEQLETFYQKFVGEVSFSSLTGYVSVKTSLRPDRRLQLAHEGSLMKAIHAHIVTRKWLLNQKNLKYYAVSTSISDADQKALNTIATHSLITVNQEPLAAVDAAYKVDSVAEAMDFFDNLL